MSEEILIVAPNHDFHNFIINSFLKSYRDSKKELNNKEYYSTYSKIILDFISKHEIKVAVNPDNQNQIYGWLMCDPVSNCLIYAYVKYPFRRFGIFNELCMKSSLDWDAQVFYRFQTPTAKTIANNLNLIYTELLWKSKNSEPTKPLLYQLDAHSLC